MSAKCKRQLKGMDDKYFMERYIKSNKT